MKQWIECINNLSCIEIYFNQLIEEQDAI
jgi:hypothetical protein